MHIAVAPFKLNSGVTEDALITASADFQRDFVVKQEGVIQRILAREGEDGYVDLVFFTDAEAMAAVLAAEENDTACAAYMSLMDSDGTYHVYDTLTVHE